MSSGGAFLSAMGFGFTVKLIDEASGKLRTIGTELNNSTKSTEKLLGSVSALQTQMKVGFGAALGGFALSAPLLAAANTAGDFEYALGTVVAITKATNTQLDLLRKKAIGVALVSKFAPQEIVEGMRNFATMGFTVQEIIQSSKAMADLATASFGQLNLALSGEVIGGALRSFGLNATHTTEVVDKLVRIT